VIVKAPAKRETAPPRAAVDVAPPIAAADAALPITAAVATLPEEPGTPPDGTSPPAGGGGAGAAGSVQAKRSRPVRRWAAAPVLAAAAYVCWVLARQVLWGIQEKEPWTLLSVSALVYLVAVAWTMVLVAVTLWSSHRAGRLFWPWALLVSAPGIAYLYRFAALNKDWGGSLGAEFYEMIALVGALALLVLVALIGVALRLAPSARRLVQRLRREPSSHSPA
jgi:hypothetical protein